MSVQARVFILPEGKIQIFIDNGTEEEAIEASKKIMANMQASGVNFESIGEVELHRTGGEHAHIVNEVRNEQRQQ
jgi:hypothetical protein